MLADLCGPRVALLAGKLNETIADGISLEVLVQSTIMRLKAGVMAAEQTLLASTLAEHEQFQQHANELQRNIDALEALLQKQHLLPEEAFNEFGVRKP